jgi:tetratricopeptide (TPR) repeat protein
MHAHIVKKKPNTAKETLLTSGARLMQAKQYAEACRYYEELIIKYPNDASLHYCSGVALHQNKQLLQAIGAYCKALDLNPKLTEAFENLAEAQTELKLFSDALVSIRAAIEINPKKAFSYTRLCRILIYLGKLEEAIDAANHALALDPKSAATYFMRSNAYKGLNQLSESIADLRQAMVLDPKNPEFPYNLSFDLLLSEKFEEGWRYYESRFQTDNFLKSVPQMVTPQWNGIDSLEGKVILICPEQGLGDQIQFARYALVLMELGAKVIMPVAPQLVEIVQSMHPDVFVTSYLQPASALPKHDCHVPLMSLMGIFNTHLSNIPFADSYLSPNSNISKKWAERFPNRNKLQVGVTWSGSQVHVNDHNRSMSLTQLAPLLNLDVDWQIGRASCRERVSSSV